MRHIRSAALSAPSIHFCPLLLGSILALGCTSDRDDAPEEKDWFDEVPEDGGGAGAGGSDDGGDGGAGEDDGGDEGGADGAGGSTGGSTGTDPEPDPDPEPDEVFGISEVAIYELDCFLTFEIWASAADCEACTLAFDAHLVKVEDSCGVGPEEMWGQYAVMDGAMYWLDVYRGPATYGGGMVRWDTGDYEMYGYTYSYSGYMVY